MTVLVLSPFCSDDLHDQCAGTWALAPCCCDCHTTPTTEGAIAMAENVETIESAEDAPVEQSRAVTRPAGKKGKKPQDHLPKAVKPKVEKITRQVPDGVDDEGEPKTRSEAAYAVTHRGVTVTVAEDALDDFELLDDLGQVEAGNAGRLPALLRRLIGPDFAPVLDALRGPNGRVKIEDAGEYLGELLGAIAPN